MIWAIISSRSCFCWLYRASPSLVAKNIINMILVLTIWWCPSVESSLVLSEEGICYDQWILLAKCCWPLPCFIPYSKVKFACYSRCFLTFAFQSPIMKRTSFLGVTSWEIDVETVEIVSDFILGASKITADGDCSHEIKRRLLLGRKVMTNLDSIFKSRGIT